MKKIDIELNGIIPKLTKEQMRLINGGVKRYCEIVCDDDSSHLYSECDDDADTICDLYDAGSSALFCNCYYS